MMPSICIFVTPSFKACLGQANSVEKNESYPAVFSVVIVLFQCTFSEMKFKLFLEFLNSLVPLGGGRAKLREKNSNGTSLATGQCKRFIFGLALHVVR